MTQHGTNSKYQQGCRCGKCREAHSEAQRIRRALPPRKITCGKQWAYRKGCRCELCVEWRAAENVRQLDRYYAKHPRPDVPANPARFDRICRYSEKLLIPLADAARLVDRMGL